jgi:hypothetical protein
LGHTSPVPQEWRLEDSLGSGQDRSVLQKMTIFFNFSLDMMNLGCILVGDMGNRSNSLAHKATRVGLLPMNSTGPLFSFLLTTPEGIPVRREFIDN